MTPEMVMDMIAKYNNLTSVDLRRTKVDGLNGSHFMGRVRCAAVYLVQENFPILKHRELQVLFNRKSRDGITDDIKKFKLLYDRDKHFKSMVDCCREYMKSWKKNFISIEENINYSIANLVNHGTLINPAKWQSTDIKVGMKEVYEIYFQSPIPRTIIELQNQCKPDLPWAENHFKERVDGIESNPGKEYLNWPYYKNGQDFKEDGDKFSHTYMERFWPKFAGTPVVEPDFNFDAGDDEMYLNKGIRYPYGDLLDIVNRLADDPFTRQAYLSVWHPEDQSNEVARRLPCTIGYFFQLRDGKLNVTYHIRSCDAVRHFRNDIYMAGRLCQWVASKIPVRPVEGKTIVPGNINVWIGNFHCFESDLYTLKKKNKI